MRLNAVHSKLNKQRRLQWSVLGALFCQVLYTAWLAFSFVPNKASNQPEDSVALAPAPTLHGVAANKNRDKPVKSELPVKHELPIKPDLLLIGSLNESSQIRVQEPPEFFGDRRLQLSKEPPISSLHCVGETFNETRTSTPASLYRSCHYENLCYHVHDKRLVLVPSAQHWKLLSMMHPDIHVSSVSKPVMMSAVEQQDPGATSTVTPLYITPTSAIETDSSFAFIMNEPDAVWVPIQPESCDSVVWDVFLPVYTLLEMFELQTKPWRLVITGDTACTRQQLEEYADMMGLTTNDIVFLAHDVPVQEYKKSQFLCFQQSVMGIGAHADHQVMRPLTEGDLTYIPTNHIRRERNLRGFRTHCLTSLRLTPQRAKPYIVTYESSLSSIWTPPSTIAGIEIRTLSSQNSLRTQMQLTTKTSILVLASDQDKTAAFFLPDGATLILLGEAQEDWDLWSNNALLRVHLVTNRTDEAMEFLIRDELSRLEQQDLPNKKAREDPPVNFINNRTVTLVHDSPPTTRVHCVGEKLFPNTAGANLYRSCHFENVCFDLKSKSFVLFPSPLSFQWLATNSSFSALGNYFSTIPRQLVASPQPFKNSRFLDIPRIRSTGNISSYYRLEGTWLGTMTFRTKNVGHILWDVWLPMYTLLEMFGLEGEALLVTRYPSRNDAPPTNTDIEKVMGYPNRTSQNVLLTIPHAKSNYVCADHGASGFGWLTDHGITTHGWKPRDLEFPMNLRRGPELRRWRDSIVQKVGLPVDNKLEAPFSVTFSIKSSQKLNRRIEFEEEIAAVRNLPNVQVHVQHFHSLELAKQVDIASRSTIFISVVGGGTLPAFFLPRGATLILYGDKDMYLDFDLFNNYGQIRVHWMSLTTRLNDIDILLNLIQDELESLARRNQPQG